MTGYSATVQGLESREGRIIIDHSKASKIPYGKGLQGLKNKYVLNIYDPSHNSETLFDRYHKWGVRVKMPVKHRRIGRKERARMAKEASNGIVKNSEKGFKQVDRKGNPLSHNGAITPIVPTARCRVYVYAVDKTTQKYHEVLRFSHDDALVAAAKAKQYRGVLYIRDSSGQYVMTNENYLPNVAASDVLPRGGRSDSASVKKLRKVSKPVPASDHISGAGTRIALGSNTATVIEHWTGSIDKITPEIGQMLAEIKRQKESTATI